MDKRTVLAIALSILVLLAFQYLFQPAGVINDNISNSEVVESRDMSELKGRNYTTDPYNV